MNKFLNHGSLITAIPRMYVAEFSYNHTSKKLTAHNSYLIMYVMIIYLLIFYAYVCRWKKSRRVNFSLHKQHSNPNSNNGTSLQDGQNKTTVPVYSEIFTELKVMQNSQT